MIGLLFSNGKLDKYSNKIQAILNMTEANIDTIVAFTIDNINLKDKTFYGNILSKSSIMPVTLKLPEVIFNFSIQYKSTNIKKLRQLSEFNDIDVINETNKFNQLMIMQMLSCDTEISNYLLPYESNSKEKLYTDMNTNNIVIMPERGASFSKIIYFEGDNFYSNNLKMLKDEKINFIIPKNYSLALKTPKLITYDKAIPIFRIYLQRGANSSWRFLTSKVSLKDMSSPEKSINILKDIALIIANYINNFIPNLGNCFIDFIIDLKGNPYFIHLGGWDYKLFKGLLDEDLQKELLKNLSEYAYYSSIGKGNKYVG